MKKVLISLAAASTLLLSSANADTITTRGIYLTGGVIDFKGIGVNTTVDTTGVEYGFGWGGEKIWESGFTTGGNIEFNYIDIDKDISDSDTSNSTTAKLYSTVADIKAGYTYKDFTMLGMVALAAQGINDYISVGYGFGGELQYKIIKQISLGVNYRYLKMDPVVGDNYDYNTIKGFLRYNF